MALNTDIEVIRHCVRHHGKELFLALSTKYPDVNLTNTSADSSNIERKSSSDLLKNEKLRKRLLHVIIKSSSSLFSPRESHHAGRNRPYDGFSPVAPLEMYMDVPPELRLERLFQDLKQGDIVLGQVTSITDCGLSVALLALDVTMNRYIKDLKITATCPVRDLPKEKSYKSALDGFEVRDKVRGVVTAVSQVNETITISLLQSALPSALQYVQLGHVSEDELPSHCRKAEFASDYELNVTRCRAFHNPCSVALMAEMLDLDEKRPPSLFPELNRASFKSDEYAEQLRNAQSCRLAMKSVQEGIEHLKHGRQVESMQCLKKALQIDEHNVEALVARGALYANTGSFSCAVDDFEEALHHAPEHTNAKYYLYETLVAQANSLIENNGDAEARKCAERALNLRPAGEEAKKIIEILWKRAEKLKKLSSVVEVSSDSETEDNVAITEAAGKLRHLMANEHSRYRSNSKSEQQKKSRKSRSSSCEKFSSENELHNDDESCRLRKSSVNTTQPDSDSLTSKTKKQRKRPKSRSSSRSRSRNRRTSRKKQRNQHRSRSSSGSRSSSLKTSKKERNQLESRSSSRSRSRGRRIISKKDRNRQEAHSSSRSQNRNWTASDKKQKKRRYRDDKSFLSSSSRSKSRERMIHNKKEENRSFLNVKSSEEEDQNTSSKRKKSNFLVINSSDSSLSEEYHAKSSKRSSGEQFESQDKLRKQQPVRNSSSSYSNFQEKKAKLKQNTSSSDDEKHNTQMDKELNKTSKTKDSLSVGNSKAVIDVSENAHERKSRSLKHEEKYVSNVPDNEKSRALSKGTSDIDKTSSSQFFTEKDRKLHEDNVNSKKAESLKEMEAFLLMLKKKKAEEKDLNNSVNRGKRL